MRSVITQQLDRIGIGLSGLCLAQCLLLPVLVTVLPSSVAAFFGDEWFHLALIFLVLPVSLIAFASGYRRHQRPQVLLPAVLGLSALVAAAALHDSLGATGSRVVTLLGAMSLALAHWINYRLCRRIVQCDSCNHHELPSADHPPATG